MEMMEHVAWILDRAGVGSGLSFLLLLWIAFSPLHPSAIMQRNCPNLWQNVGASGGGLQVGQQQKKHAHKT